MTIYQNITQLTGKTPLVRVSRLNPNPEVEILAKLETFNPTHSVKDRIAVSPRLRQHDHHARGRQP